MSDFFKFTDIINIIPDILIYFVPGFIFISVRNYHLSFESSKDKYIALKSIVFSYIFINLVGIIYSKNNRFFTILVLMLSVIVSILYITFDVEEELLKRLKLHKSTNNDFMHNIINIKEGAWLYMYLSEENVIYCGKLICYHDIDNGKERIYVLSNYVLCSYEGKQLQNFSENDNRNVMLNSKNITRIEIVK